MMTLARHGFLVLAARGSAAVAAFGLAFAVAQVLGAEGSGIYYLAVAVGTVVAVLGRAGLDTAVLRFLAEALDADDAGGARTVYRNGVVAAAVWSAALASLVALAAPLLSRVLGADTAGSGAIRAGALLVPTLALLHIHLQAMNALRRQVTATVVALVTPPAIAALLLWLWPGINPQEAVLVSVLGGAVGVAVGALIVRSALTEGPRRAHVGLRTMLGTAAPLLVVSSIGVATQWTDVMVIGAFRDPASVGVYAPAARVAVLVSLVLVAFGSIVAPQFAVLERRGERQRLEAVARQSAAIGSLVAIPLALVMLVAAPAIMRIFGTGFDEGANALRILAVGQLAHVGAGSVGYALSMTGHERLLRRSSLTVLVANVTLNLMLVPRFGIEGAATATALSVLAMNTLNVWWVRKHLGVQPLPFLKPLLGGSDAHA